MFRHWFLSCLAFRDNWRFFLLPTKSWSKPWTDWKLIIGLKLNVAMHPCFWGLFNTTLIVYHAYMLRVKDTKLPGKHPHNKRNIQYKLPKMTDHLAVEQQWFPNLRIAENIYLYIIIIIYFFRKHLDENVWCIIKQFFVILYLSFKTSK